MVSTSPRAAKSIRDRHYWIMKSEPSKYSFAQLTKEKKTRWDGVRNYEARNNLRAMQPGDLALFYHSNEDRSAVGVVRVCKEAYKDPSAPDEDWSVVEVEALSPLKVPVPLESLRADPTFDGMALLTRPRLSVLPMTRAHFERILKLGKTRLK